MTCGGIPAGLAAKHRHARVVHLGNRAAGADGIGQQLAAPVAAGEAGLVDEGVGRESGGVRRHRRRGAGAGIDVGKGRLQGSRELVLVVGLVVDAGAVVGCIRHHLVGHGKAHRVGHQVLLGIAVVIEADAGEVVRAGAQVDVVGELGDVVQVERVALVRVGAAGLEAVRVRRESSGTGQPWWPATGCPSSAAWRQGTGQSAGSSFGKSVSWVGIAVRDHDDEVLLAPVLDRARVG